MVEGKRLDLVGSDRDNQAQERFDKGCGYICQVVMIRVL